MTFLSRSNKSKTDLKSSADGFKAKLTDPDAITLWKKAGKVDEPPVPQFLKAFEECMKSWQVPMGVDDILLIQSFMGVKPGAERVTITQFTELVSALGSVRSIIPTMRKLAKEEWWCGWLGGEESTEILCGQPRGTYMGRFTRSFPGCLAITFISPEAETRSMVFQRIDGPLVLKSDDSKSNTATLVQFQDLHSAITGFRGNLTTAFTSLLTKKDWYRDNIADRAAAEDALAHLKPGTFVIWPDPTTPNRFISSLVMNPGGFIHTEINTNGGDFRSNNPQNIPSPTSLQLPQESRARVLLQLQNHIRLNRHMLKYPIKTGTVPLLYLHGALRGETPIEALPPLSPNSSKLSDMTAILEAPIKLSPDTSPRTVGSNGQTTPPNNTGALPSTKQVQLAESPSKPLSEPPVSRLYVRGDSSHPPSAVARLVAERFCIQQFHNWTVVAAADGCEEETKNIEAASKAVAGFVESMKNQKARVIDVLEAEHCLLRALNFSHTKIVEGKDPRYVSVGSATLIGGVIVELAEADRMRDYRYAFVCANLGNWKAFVYSPENGDSFLEVTADNRTPSSSKQLRQPGGRLGAYIDNSKPDIKSLESYCELVREGDIVVLVSDGIHTNLDPRNLGKTPTEMGMPYATWEEVPQRQFHTACRLFEANLLKRIAGAARLTAPNQIPSAGTIANALVEYTIQITAALRQYVVENPGASSDLPLSERKALPGCLGECTAIAIHVGRTKQQREARLSLSASAPALVGSTPLRSSGAGSHAVIPSAASGPIHSSPMPGAAIAPRSNGSTRASGGSQINQQLPATATTSSPLARSAKRISGVLISTETSPLPASSVVLSKSTSPPADD